VAVCAGVVACFLALAAAAPPNGASGHGLSASERGQTAARAAPLVAVPVESFVALPRSGVPPAGEASASGCAAARAYLAAYAAPGFAVRCPGYADGHQAATMCASAATTCSTDRFIAIADPCPAAYMNEAANSWVLSGLSDAPLDPYGACP
jgi:hypothetical protein